MPVITCIEDLKRLHQKRTPKMFWDYCESGSYTEQTFRENSSDFAQIRFRQRVARDLTGRDLSSTMAGQPVSMPVALAPVGSAGMQHPDGEIHAARNLMPARRPDAVVQTVVDQLEADDRTGPLADRLAAEGHAEQHFVCHDQIRRLVFEFGHQSVRGLHLFGQGALSGF